MFTLISLFTVTSVSNFLTYLFSIQAIPVFFAYSAINSGIEEVFSKPMLLTFSDANNATNRSISLAAVVVVVVVVVVAVVVTLNLSQNHWKNERNW